MIVFDLICAAGHRFEGWFGSSDDFARQQADGQLACPQCGAVSVSKAPMAPAVPAKGNQRGDAGEVLAGDAHKNMTAGDIPAEVRAAMAALAKAQAKALKDSRWVGDSFVDESRAMHYGEKALEAIHGHATMEQARELLEEGVEVAPLLVPVADPDSLN